MDPYHLTEIRVIVSSRAVISGCLRAATIIISRTTGKIIAVFNSVTPASNFPAGTLYTDYSPYVLLPGLVDTHVHLNDPGRADWEGFYTGTQAAASGGVTTIIDMPLNSIPPTTTVANLKEKLRAAHGRCWVDVGFYGGVIPGNAGELKALVKEGVRGFKGFLIDSGVDEFPAVSLDDIRMIMTELANEPTILIFHAEMPGDTEPPQNGPVEAYSTFLASRPSSYETRAVEKILSLAPLAPNLPLHIAHLSAMEAIPSLRKARANGISITAETCFHYLSLTAEDIHNGDTRYKCYPPIRSRLNQDCLWEELERHADDGVIKTIVSDHSPCTPEMKLLPLYNPDCFTYDASSTIHEGSFLLAWGGISSVGLGLSILWNELSRRRNLDTSTDATSIQHALQDIAQLCCINTATQVGLGQQKGDLVPGHDADICVFDETIAWTVDPSTMRFRNKLSPYQGRKLRGLVRETWLHGEKVFSREFGFTSKTPTGRLILAND
ncbi:allantoinase [Aspergillus japonicus CBS 114.51]|uniref:allantoinase n=1 Tax=Aspergillus japonicus CBS 114.51 TaxID=1448312 RepID=A0A8T8WYV8_ASPJA|nr:allantoinase [Aspergillus japonicus CBS 114.51]RAH80864.1 allantoinase [Aspergillus japonicus CBS 114.51]